MFDQLEGFVPKGRLYLAATEAGNRYLVRGPEHKIDSLVDTGRWELMRVHQQWKGDDEEATLRTLHGKALCLITGSRARIITGSANVTRAALLVPPPNGNVELVVAIDADVASSRAMLPQASKVSRDDLDIEIGGDPTGEDDAFEEGAERWVESALYWAARSELELRLVEGAPQLVVRYDGSTIGKTNGQHTRLQFPLRGPLYVEVDDHDRIGVVPMIIADPAQFVPRGTPTDLDDETFFLYLAGARDIEPIPGDLPPFNGSTPAPAQPDEFRRRGAIPWRRLLAALNGVGAELVREAPFPRGVAFVLENETRLGGLRRRLRKAHEQGRLLDADYAYALHELLRIVTATQRSMEDHPESQNLVDATAKEIRDESHELTRRFDGAVAAQLEILSRELAV